MDLLLRSVAMGIRYAVPHMKHRNGAAIVNTSSVAAVGPGYSPTAYAVAKAGVLHLTKMRRDRPGATRHPGQRGPAGLHQHQHLHHRAWKCRRTMVDTAKAMITQMSSNAQPVARSGMPDDIANAVAFLCSDAAELHDRRLADRRWRDHDRPAPCLGPRSTGPVRCAARRMAEAAK